MKTHRRACALLVLTLLPLQLYATGRMQCEPISQEDWLSDTELKEKLVTDGWVVRRMKVDGGCWEVYGTTPEGERVEAYFHPATGQKLLVARRGEILFRAGSS